MTTTTSDRQAALLTSILAAIAPLLSSQEAEDIASFIDAGEKGLAADTIFCAISEDDIDVDGAVREELAQVADLYNTFGDLDPDGASKVLDQGRRPSPSMW